MSRQKGNAAEREVAKKIQIWWRHLEPTAEFVRTPLSGGWGGPSLRGEFGAAGDLMTTAKRFPYGVEVKRREKWALHCFMAGKPCPVWKWWWQTQEAAAEMKKIPMMWIRHNREDWLVVLPIGSLHIDYDHVWTSTELQGVNYGTHEPAIYKAERLLASIPIPSDP